MTRAVEHFHCQDAVTLSLVVPHHSTLFRVDTPHVREASFSFSSFQSLDVSISGESLWCSPTIDTKQTPTTCLVILIYRRGEAYAIAILEYCERAKMAFIPWFPLAAGQVSGARRPSQTTIALSYDADDERAQFMSIPQGTGAQATPSAALSASSKSASLNGLNRHSTAPCSIKRRRTVSSR